MPQPIPIFRQVSGLHTLDDPVRLAWNPETGIIALPTAVNINIDKTNWPSRRMGYDKMASANISAAYTTNDYCLIVAEGSSEASLCLLTDIDTGSYRTITTGLTLNQHTSFMHMGPIIFWANGFEMGYWMEGDQINPLTGASSGIWEAPTGYIGPMGFDYTVIQSWTHTQQKARGAREVKRNPPLGHIVGTIGGYAVMAIGSRLYFSLPNHPFYWRWDGDYCLFEGEITMFKKSPREDGAWVGDTTGTYWLQGGDPLEWITKPGSRSKVSECPPVPYCVAIDYYDARNSPHMLQYGFRELAAVWMTNPSESGLPGGLCMGGPAGFFVNLTDKDIALPHASHGSAVVIGDRVIVSLKP